MRYARAQDVLPAQLLSQLQEYIDGAYLYVPRKEENRLSWGQRTNSKRETAERNREICRRAMAGEDTESLAREFFLTQKTIKRIIFEGRSKD